MSDWYKLAKQVKEEGRQREVERVRRERDTLLKDSDYVMLPDYPLNEKSQWKTYRQALRDITEQTGFPDNVEWPVKPGVK